MMSGKLGDFAHRVSSLFAVLAAGATTVPHWSPYASLFLWMSALLGGAGAVSNAVKK